MAVYELEPAHEVGFIRWGVELGRRVDQVESEILVQEQKWDEEEGSAIAKEGRVPIHWWDFSGFFVTPKGPDAVTLTTWTDTDIYGYVQTILGDLRGQEINAHPIVGRKLRFIPD